MAGLALYAEQVSANTAEVRAEALEAILRYCEDPAEAAIPVSLILSRLSVRVVDAALVCLPEGFTR